MQARRKRRSLVKSIRQDSYQVPDKFDTYVSYSLET
jgi:hypothetical protein